VDLVVVGEHPIEVLVHRAALAVQRWFPRTLTDY